MKNTIALLRPPPHADTGRPPAAVLPPGPPLVALGPDSSGWLCPELEPTFDCPAEHLTEVAELIAVGALPPAVLELYSPRSADQLRRLVAVLQRDNTVQPSTLTRSN